MAEALEREDGSIVTLGGVITGLARKFTKKGDQMAVFTLEDLDSAIECTVFPRVLIEQGHKLVDDAIVTVKGPTRQARRVAGRVHGPGRHDPREPRHLVVVAAASQGAGSGAQRVEDPSAAGGSCATTPVSRWCSSTSARARSCVLADEFCVDLDRVVPELRVALGHDAVML